ncbi:hypothetical protein BH10PSE2_BH10PSE2_17660 [soil metagenome]
MVEAAVSEQDIEAFIARWADGEGGAERANCQIFLSELCDVLGVERPRPAGATAAANDYVFERAVRRRESEGGTAPLRIDLYKRDCFILEAKQSRLTTGRAQANSTSPRKIGSRAGQAQGDLFATTEGRTRGWDALMVGARRQAEDYVFRLDSDHRAPPFVIVCDVGRCLELYADFSGSGRAYNQFPDRGGFRIRLPDLRKAEVRGMLATVWSDPASLDPTRKAALVTRAVAERLAGVSRDMEARGCRAEDVAQFLMRCVFTMFAEDVDLLPAGSFTGLLEKSLIDPAHFGHRLKALWAAMETGEDFCFAIEAAVRHFNGGLFERTTVFELRRDEITRLLEAAKADWRGVEPAIFGALLEQALDPVERRKLGAHYTPRAYVERLVEATVMEPLRQDWARVLYVAEPAAAEGDNALALKAISDFHRRLREVRVLDPACGTGNFLYVAFDMMKKLEGEVIQRLVDLGETPPAAVIPDGVVGPGQFLGMEINERAAHIAELVVWIGYLQWRARASTEPPAEPILMSLKSIRRMDAVMTSDQGLTPTFERIDGAAVEVHHDPRQPAWPKADFIVGNPPFMGGKDIRARLGGTYAKALWAAHPDMNDSADFVMYWWNEAARRLADPGDPLRRFGLVTTNSISQVFQRRVVERWLGGASPISLTLAIPDHPWTRVGRDAAAVRIAMTVAEAGRTDGVVRELESEAGLDTDTPMIVFRDLRGRVNADLTVGADVTKAKALMANAGLCSPGMKLHGAGFIVTEERAKALGLGLRERLDHHIRPYRNGRDLMAHSREVFVVDFFGLTEADIRARYPEAYQHLLQRVKPQRDSNNRAVYRENWWTFGEPRRDLRPALEGLGRAIATVETAKHRAFQFLDAAIIPDNKLICIADADGFTLGVLSSSIHTVWARLAGGWLGAGNDSVYVKTKVFDPFPFPNADEVQRAAIAAVAEELDATRKRVLAENPDLTLTGLYNVMEKARAGVDLSPAERDSQYRGQVLILKRLHDLIDLGVAEAYGWPVDLDEQSLLGRILALNTERVAQEMRGEVAWLRPAYQAPKFGKGAFAVEDAGLDPAMFKQPTLPLFPTRREAQPLAVMDELARAGGPLSVAMIAGRFRKGGPRIEPRVREVLAVLSQYGHVANPANDVYETRLRA